MAEHIDHLDKRERRCNIRVVRLPEDTEGTRPVKLFEEWIPGNLATWKPGNLATYKWILRLDV